MTTPLRRTALQLSWPLLTAAALPLAFAGAPLSAVAQTTQSVSGRVTGTDGNGLPGVSVVVAGTTQGTTTNAEGVYNLQGVPAGATLTYSFVGYATQRVAVSGRTAVDVKLLEDVQSINEVVVVGYGVQKKSQVTGAISSVDEQQLRDVPVANVGQALQGRAAGVTISNTSTTPGQAPVIRIRGNRSFSGSNDPLLVVDGVPFDGSLNDLNPDDITSLEVLKDASSTAIYGARGANGVILITTRRGKSGAARATYSGYIGTKRPYGRYDLQDGQEFYNYRLEAFRAQNPNYDPATPAFLTADERANYAAGRTTDYQDQLFQNGRIQNHVLGVSGGTDITQYSTSLGYYDETGIVPVQRFQRFSLRGTLDQQVGTRVKVGLNTLNTYNTSDDANINILNQILTTSPLASTRDANGNLVLYPNGDTAGSNPLTLYAQDAHKDQNRRVRTFNSLYGQVNIFKGLDYRLNLGLDVRSENNGNFFASQTPQNGGGQNTASRSASFAFNLLTENILTYNRTFAEKHDVNFTGLYSWQGFRFDNTGVGVRGLIANNQYFYNLGAGTPSSASSNRQRWDIVSYMGRVNYAYNNRYSATLTVRVDGSSRLAPGNKYKAFPSAAVAWNLANESFMQDRSWVSNLKLRASLGRVGSTAVNPYQTLGALGSGIGNGYYNWGSTGAVGVVPNSIPNDNLGWEYTTTTNFGLDYGFFDNRISGSVEVYQQRTSDLLLPDALPTASGFGSYVRNAGQTQNRGVEVTLSTVNVRSEGGFEWSTDWNFTMNREKVLDLDLRDASGNSLNDLGNQRFLNQPLYVFYDFKKLGIWQTSEADEARKYGSKPGQIKVQDTDGNGTINANDRVIIGTRQPKFEAGLTNRFKFKGFDLTAVAITRVGATVVDPTLFGPNYFTTNTGRRNQLNLNYWTPNNPSNEYPQPDQTSRSTEWPTYGQTLAYRNGTFIKVRSIDLGYSLPTGWAKKAFLSTARIYVQAQNPLLWSKDKFFRDNKAIDPDALSYSTRLDPSQPGGIAFTGGNPNVTTGGTSGGNGVNYPFTRAFIVGVNLGF